MFDTKNRRGITAIEVLASTILAALLMTALIGVLRGLKAHEQSLESRVKRPSGQRSLDAAIETDLKSADTYELSPERLTLRGHGGHNQDGAANWLPATVTYEVCRDRDGAWLVRRELPTAGGGPPRPANLMLTGVTEIRLSVTPVMDGAADEPPVLPPFDVSSLNIVKETPLPADLVIEFWSSNQTAPLYEHRCRL
jgi:hypothetical protein